MCRRWPISAKYCLQLTGFIRYLISIYSIHSTSSSSSSPLLTPPSSSYSFPIPSFPSHTLFTAAVPSQTPSSTPSLTSQCINYILFYILYTAQYAVYNIHYTLNTMYQGCSEGSHPFSCHPDVWRDWMRSTINWCKENHCKVIGLGFKYLQEF